MANSRTPLARTAPQSETQILPASKSRKFFLSEGLPIELEEKYLTLVESAPDIIFIIDLKGHLLYLNKTAQKITGYPLSKMLKKNLKEFAAPEFHDSIKKILNKLREGNHIPFYEVEVISANDEKIPLEIHIKPVKDPKGRTIALQGIARDLTERKKVEEALKESEKKYSTLVEKARDGVAIIQDGVCKFANTAVEKLTGYPLKELIDKPIFDKVPPEDKELLAERYKRRITGKKVPSVYQTRILCKDGKIKDVEISAAFIPYKGRHADLAIIRDLSERRSTIEKLNKAYREVQATEAKLKAILDKAPNVAIQGFNNKGEVLFWNSSSEKLFGIAEDEIIGKTLKEINISKEQELEFKDLLKNLFHKKKPSSLMEWTITTKKGENRDILCSLFPTFLPGQEPVAIAMCVDITDRKKAEEKIKEMNRQVERFSEISADILSTEDEEELFNRIAQAVVDISDFNRVLISYFIDEPPYREIIGHKGVRKKDLERVNRVEMPREKYLKYFEQGLKIGSQSCYIPHNLKDILDQKAVIPGEKIYPEKEGLWHREDNLLVSMKDTKGQVIGIISVDDSKSGLIPTNETVRPLEIYANLISEIIQRRKLVKKIKASEEKYRELVGNIQVGILRATPEGELLEANPSALELFGYAYGETFLHVKIEDLYENCQDHEKFMKEIEKKGLMKNKEFLLRKRDGSTFWASITSTAIEDASGQIVYYDNVIEDVTERRKLEKEVKRLSVTDELTGLFNRRYFNKHLPEEIKTAERWRSTLSFIMIDIDDFKPYNDNFHHLKGDEVIKEVAQVISQNIRKGTDWASRFGGDEFAIILPGTDASEATAIAERIREGFHKIKFKPEGNTIQKTISMGVAYCYYHDTRPKKQITDYQKDYEHIATELTNLADHALFKAKKSGKNKVYITKRTIELSRMP